MANSRIPEAIDALVSRLQAASGLSDATVFDGPKLSGAAPQRMVFVGYDGSGDPDSGFTVGTADQQWRGIGAKARRETPSIVCACVVNAGDRSVKSARDAVFELFGEVEGEIVAEPSLGLPPPSIAVISSVVHTMVPTQRGLQSRITFQIDLQTRI